MTDRTTPSTGHGDARDGDGGRDADRRDARAMIATGLGIGALGAVTAAIGGALCPVCVVAAPALVGAGAYRAWRARRPRGEGGDR